MAQQTFLAASAGIPLSSFENYIRGIDSASPQESIKRLALAMQATPNYTAATLALGKAYFAQRDYDRAAATFARIPRSDRRALEAGFFTGLARFNTAKYADAEAAFAYVGSRLPLPEVINNQGVAASRQGRDATAFFQRVVGLDPNDPDYHFNLAVSLLRRRDFAGAQREASLCLKLRPADAEAAQLRDAAAHGTPIAAVTDPAATTDPAAFAPLERIRRTYSEATFRQAAFQLEQMQEAHLATLPPAAQADGYVQQGQAYLSQGLLPEAEQEFQHALVADPSSYVAHAGLAEVRERSGSVDDARAEAEASLRTRPNVPAYLVLARLELQQNALAASAANVNHALEIDPPEQLGPRHAPGTRQPRPVAAVAASDQCRTPPIPPSSSSPSACFCSSWRASAPGRVIPGSVGLLLLLLGVHRLASLPLRPSALLLIGAAVLLLALLLRPRAPLWIGIVSTVALTVSIPRLVDTRAPASPSGVTLWIGALAGLLLGLSSSLLLRIGARARANKYRLHLAAGPDPQE